MTDRPLRLPLFLLLSLLLHLALLQALPWSQLIKPPTLQERKVQVELRPAQPAARELDETPPPTTRRPRTEPAKRLGPEDRVARKETAPRGHDNFDTPGAHALPSPTPVRPVHPKNKPAAAPSRHATPPRPAAPTGTLPPAQHRSPAVKPSVPTPDLKHLTQLPDTTRERYREREQTEDGDLSLDMKQDMLTSFFRRFRLHVLGAWNYPAISRERGEQGACLARVTVDKQGNLLDLQLLQSSGYGALDDAALHAVRRSAPYGPLSDHYPEPHVSFNVLFIYQMNGWSRDLQRR